MNPKTKEQISEEILDFLKKHENTEFSLNKIKESFNYKSKFLRRILKKLIIKCYIQSKTSGEGKVYLYFDKGKKKRKLKTNILVLVFTIISILIFGEVIVRIYFAYNDKVLGRDLEEICDKDEYKRLLEKRQRIQKYEEYNEFLEYSNYSGIRPKANRDIYLEVNRGNKKIRYFISNTNSMHMKGLKDISYNKTPNKTRIALLGDSFTWGTDVSIKYSYASLLEEIVPNSEILNFGIEGIGIDVMFLRWKFESVNFKPDITIFAIYIDDIARARPCINKPKLIVENNKLKIKNFPPPTPEQILKNYKEPKFESYLIKHFLFTLKYFPDVEQKEYDYGFELLDLMLDEMILTSKETNSTQMVLVIERGNDYNNSKLQLKAIKRLKSLLMKKSIIYLNSEDVFSQENYIPIDNSVRKRYENNSHFTPEGYGILANGIKNKLEKQQIIPKSKNYNFIWIIDSDEEVDSRILQRLILQNKKNSSDFKIIYPYEVIG